MPKAGEGHSNQDGFSLAALIVILTIISIIVAYTVPTQWSLVMRREREKQTVFLMKQFARAILTWEQKHQGLPASLAQLQEARQPRMLRGDGKWPMPLTGREDDWILVPPTALVPDVGGATLTGVPNRPNPANPPPQVPQQPGQPTKLNPEASPKDYVGPFVAVRPNASGPSLLKLNGAEDYSQWVYTLQDLKNDIALQQLALSVPK